MPRRPVYFLGRWRDVNINKGLSWMSCNKGLVLPKPSSPTKRLDSRVLRGYCGAQWSVGQAHLLVGVQRPKPRKVMAQARQYKYEVALGHSRGRFTPRHNRGLTRRKGKNGIKTTLEKKSKISEPIKRGMLESVMTRESYLTAIQYSAPDRAILSSFYNHPQPLWVWADGTSISLGVSILHMDEG